MPHPVEIPVGNAKEFLSGLYEKPQEATTPERDKTLALMVHGFPGMHKYSHQDLFGDLELLFSASGFHSFRFDFRGCGASEGRQENFTLSTAAEDLAAVYDWAEKQGFSSLVLVAEGLGATFSLLTPPANLRLGFFFWPVLDAQSYARRHFSGLSPSTDVKVTAHVRAGDTRVGLPFIEQLSRVDIIPALSQPRLSVLVQYGSEDDTIGLEQIDFLKHNLKARRVDVTGYQGGDHGLGDPRHRKMIFYHIGQFLTKFA